MSGAEVGGGESAERAQVSIPRPQIHTGPKGQTVDEATTSYLRDAAIRVRQNRYWGSGVTALVSDLLDAAADEVERTSVTERCMWREPHDREPDSRLTTGCGWRTLHAFEPRFLPEQGQRP